MLMVKPAKRVSYLVDEGKYAGRWAVFAVHGALAGTGRDPLAEFKGICEGKVKWIEALETGYYKGTTMGTTCNAKVEVIVSKP